MDELAEGVVGVAEAPGGLLLGDAIDEDGPQGLVLALAGAAGLSEEVLAQGVVHNRSPSVRRGVGRATPSDYTAAPAGTNGGPP